MRTLRCLAWGLLLGSSLGLGSAAADASVEPKKGKPGAACKTNADCDQSQQPQSCQNKKCEPDRIPPPT